MISMYIFQILENSIVFLAGKTTYIQTALTDIARECAKIQKIVNFWRSGTILVSKT